jgi:hypothetical protein
MVVERVFFFAVKKVVERSFTEKKGVVRGDFKNI